MTEQIQDHKQMLKTKGSACHGFSAGFAPPGTLDKLPKLSGIVRQGSGTLYYPSISLLTYQTKFDNLLTWEAVDTIINQLLRTAEVLHTAVARNQPNYGKRVHSVYIKSNALGTNLKSPQGHWPKPAEGLQITLELTDLLDF